MHFFKALGLLLLLACGVALGLLLASFHKKRCRQAEGFLALLRYIRLQIDCFSLPVERILATIDDELRADCRVPENAGDFPALLAGTHLLLPLEMQELLASFCRDLGTSYREDQLRCCDYYLSRLSPYCTRIREELPRRIKLSLLLPTALTAALLLMLI